MVMTKKIDIVNVLADTLRPMITVGNIPNLLKDIDHATKDYSSDADGGAWLTLEVGLALEADVRAVKEVPFDVASLYFEVKLMRCTSVDGKAWYDTELRWDGEHFDINTDCTQNLSFLKAQTLSDGEVLYWDCTPIDDQLDRSERLGALIIAKIYKDMQADETIRPFVEAVYAKTLELEQNLPEDNYIGP